MIGQIISHYKILAKIGEDSTGVLYKAFDAETNRPVAIKALPPGGTANPEIKRNAATASELQHPNIARIHDWFQHDSIEFAVMEPAEGESLYDFLDRERPQRRNLLRFASQISSALAAAHDAGLVHGPLNPAFIFITSKNDVRFYDFGFGVVDPPAESEENRRTQFREAAPYISPEQAQGNPPGSRSDIFSFGALVYHLTTGRLPFQAATVTETWQAVIRKAPKPVAEITSRAPRGMEKLIERCMRKNPQRRFQTIAEVEHLLEKMMDAYRQNPEEMDSFLTRNRGRIAKMACLGLVASAAVTGGVLWWQTRQKKEPVIGAHLRQITRDSGLDTDPALSADGSQIAYASDRNNSGNLEIWTQPTAGGEPTRVTNDPADDHEPAFSPDGAAIAFRSERSGGGIYVASSKGGQARLIAPEGRRPRYSPDGRSIAYWVGPPGLAPKAVGAYKLFVVSSAGGEARQIQPGFASCTDPVWSPDSKALLFLGRADAARSDPNAVDWWVAPIDGASPVNTGACRLFRRMGVLSPTNGAIPGDWKENHIFYSVPTTSGSNIWRANISPANWLVETAPAKVTTGDGIAILPSVAAQVVAFSNQSFNSDIWGLPVAANEGRVTGPLRRWTSDPAVDVSPSLSADGAKMLFQSSRTGHYNVMLLDMSSGKESPLAASPADQFWPIVSSDGSKVAWSEPRIQGYEHLYRRPGGSTEVLCQDCGPAISGWSRDGRMALVDFYNASHFRLAVGLVRLDGVNRRLVLEASNAQVRQARFSPDDRSIVFRAAIDGGATRLYIAPYHDQSPTPAQEWEPLTDGSGWESSPQWSPDGTLIYYISTRDGFHCVWAQRLDTSRRPSGRPFAVFHMHTARLSPVSLPLNTMDLYLAHDQILLSLGELIGNIWTARVSN